MKLMKGRLLTALMSLAMAFTMMPMMGSPVYADDPAPAAICLANGAAPNIKGGQKDNIYFGHYPQSEAASVEGRTENVDNIKVDDKNYLIEPIKWRALDFPSDSQGNLLPELVLLSDQNLDCKQYHEQKASITWKDSTIRAWLNAGFKNTAFLSREQEAVQLIEVVNKANPGSLTPGGEKTEDGLFLLSIKEATNKKYGFTDDYNKTTTREVKNTAYAKAQGAWTDSAGNGYWWLRSPGLDFGCAAFVYGNGAVSGSGYYVDDERFGVRPAFILNLSSVLFTSAAVGGKSSGDVGAGALKAVGTNETNEWKLTVKDDAHKEFKVESVSTCDGNTLKIKYSDAKKGDGEYISAIITDQFSNIKYYGNLKQFVDRDSTPDTAEVTIDGKLESTDKLYIINEQLNGDKKTDFSSPLQKVEIPTAYHDLVKEDKVEPTCTKPGTEEYWKCENCTEMFADKDGKTKIAEPEKISATGHKYGAWTKLNATQHRKVCEHDKSHVEKENHKWDDGKVTKKATEKATGTKTYTCTVCKAIKTETIPKLKHSHNLIRKVKVDPTCTSPGTEAYWICLDCGLMFSDENAKKKISDPVEIKAIGHKYGAWKKLNAAQHRKVCEHDKSHVEKENHKWDDGKVTKKATEKATGTKTYTCTVCKAIKTETIPKLKHSHNLIRKVKVNPACTSPGTETYWICSDCGLMFSDENAKKKISDPVKIKAIGHKYGAWKNLNATQHRRVCEHDKTHVEKENHKWDGGKVTKKATEKATGTKTYTCTVCKATKTETIPKLKPSVKNGWFKTGSSWKYFKDDKYYIGWHWMGKAEGETTEHWSYFDEKGFLLTGWQWMDKSQGEKTPHWLYFGDNGWLRTGWQWMDKSQGEKTPHWSYFGSNGWLRTGWQQMGKGTGNSFGENTSKHWSYFGGNGWLRTGWQWMDKSQGEKTPHWSYFGGNGWLRTGWQWLDKSQGEKTPHWSYFGDNGWLRTGWQWLDKSQGEKTPHWSFFGGNGWLRTGMATLGKADGEKVKHKSYFGNNGWLVINKMFSVAGKTYTADGRGWVK